MLCEHLCVMRPLGNLERHVRVQIFPEALEKGLSMSDIIFCLQEQIEEIAISMGHLGEYRG